MKSFTQCGIRAASALLCFLVCGCTASVSYTESSGGGGDDASSCIEINFSDDSAMQSMITNSCTRDVNFLEFSTGSKGLFVVPADTTLTRTETITAWGACIVPAIPTRTGDFEYFCD